MDRRYMALEGHWRALEGRAAFDGGYRTLTGMGGPGGLWSWGLEGLGGVGGPWRVCKGGCIALEGKRRPWMGERGL